MLCLCDCSNVLAEDIVYPGDKVLVPTVEAKIRRSLEGASAIVVGRFLKPSAGTEPEGLGDGTGLQQFSFQVGRWIKGGRDRTGSTITLKMAMYLPTVNSAKNSSDRERVLAGARNAEQAMSGKLIARREYVDSIKNARIAVLETNGYMQDFVLVPIKTGSLDAPYRSADVVVDFSRSYALFFMRNPPGEGSMTLFPSDMDLYDVNDPILNTEMGARR